MKILKNFSLIIFMLLLIPGYITAQQEEANPEEMQAWMDYMKPGAMHELMSKSTGNWKTINKYWMDPAGEPMITEGTAKTEMVLGGRYQVSNHDGMIMGMPMEGMSLMGFDNVTEEFTSVWIDNMGTGTAIAEGKFDEATKTLTLNGSMVDPISKSEMNFTEYLKIIDDNHHIFEMFLDYNGQEFKSLEIEFIRQ